jgi:O-methyltransferase
MMLLDQLILKAKELACATGSRNVQARLLPHYPYNFEPHQLMYLCQCLEGIRDVPGKIVELGCSAGKTTIFLNKFMNARGIEKDYYCVDTFSGFTDPDMTYEIENRGKSRVDFGSAWADWSLPMFEHTMAFSRLKRVKAVKADVKEYQFDGVSEIAFCLVDVDLYLPVKAALAKVHERLSPGGIIIVDDCVSAHKYDGARQAYCEFVQEIGQQEAFRCSKFGLIQSDAAPSKRYDSSERDGPPQHASATNQ